MDASLTCVETCIGWPNGLASFIASTISSANYRLMEVTQLALTWVGWPNGETLALTCVQIWSKWAQLSHPKSTQVHARPSQTEPQVGTSFQLASTCDSVWPGLYISTYLLRKAIHEKVKWHIPFPSQGPQGLASTRCKTRKSVQQHKKINWTLLVSIAGLCLSR